jgi:hypothetical protein
MDCGKPVTFTTEEGRYCVEHTVLELMWRGYLDTTLNPLLFDLKWCHVRQSKCWSYGCEEDGITIPELGQCYCPRHGVGLLTQEWDLMRMDDWDTEMRVDFHARCIRIMADMDAEADGIDPFEDIRVSEPPWLPI